MDWQYLRLSIKQKLFKTVSFSPTMKQLKCSPCVRITREYPILIGTGILKDNLLKLVKSYNPDKVIIISDTNVEKLYGEQIKTIIEEKYPVSIICILPGEENKTPETYLKLCDKVLQEKITKKSFILLLGGGIPGNIGGFVASTVMRGIKFGHIPTTIIAQADSTTGGKQGVNTKHGKNLLGLFNDPEFVIVDTEFLKTLTPKEIKGGLSECIKHALCQDKEFFNYLLDNLNHDAKYSHEILREIIFKTLKAKLEILRYDPKEINEGKVLVYGHTVGHAIETLANYKLTHGESISIGMMFAAYSSKELGIANDDLVKAHKDLLLKAGLPIEFLPYINEDNLIEQLRYDKKYATGMELVLLNQIGELYSKEGRIGYPADEGFIKKIYLKYFKK